MTRIHFLLPVLVFPVLLLAGCTTFDPYQRTDVWYPIGANAGNIAAMAADPHDLILGRGENGPTDSHEAVGAVDRVSLDRPKPLLVTGSAAAGGGAPASGGQN